MKDLSPILLKGRDTIANVMVHISKRALDEKMGAEYMDSLSTFQVTTYNSNMCGQDLEFKTLLMSTPELLDQIRF